QQSALGSDLSQYDPAIPGRAEPECRAGGHWPSHVRDRMGASSSVGGVMQDRPTVHELLQAVIHFLDEEAVPNLTGSRQFYGRVAANALRTVQRELEHEEEQLTEEWERLNLLLVAEDRPSTRAGLRQAIRRRTEELCQRIRQGEADA